MKERDNKEQVNLIMTKKAEKGKRRKKNHRKTQIIIKNPQTHESL